MNILLKKNNPKHSITGCPKSRVADPVGAGRFSRVGYGSNRVRNPAKSARGGNHTFLFGEA